MCIDEIFVFVVWCTFFPSFLVVFRICFSILIRIYLWHLCCLIGPSHSVWWSLFVCRFFVGLTVFSLWLFGDRWTHPQKRSMPRNFCNVNHTMLTTSKQGASCSIWDINSSLLVETQIDLISPDPKNSTTCFHGRTSTPSFQIPQIFRTISSWWDVTQPLYSLQSHFLSRSLLWQMIIVIPFLRGCTSARLTKTLEPRDTK